MKKKAPQARTPQKGKAITTIPELAETMQRQFAELASKDELFSVRDELNSRIDSVEQKLNTMHTEILSMHFDYKKLKARLESVEIRVFGSIQEP
jgi:tetrahydromethanopterin S-methyltransferase subunit G